MKQQYQTRYEWLHESYQKWLTGFTRHAVSITRSQLAMLLDKLDWRQPKTSSRNSLTML
ncbi:TPA: transposase [Escherichia coli]|nr:transposase [Escherichia coli]